MDAKPKNLKFNELLILELFKNSSVFAIVITLIFWHQH